MLLSKSLMALVLTFLPLNVLAVNFVVQFKQNLTFTAFFEQYYHSKTVDAASIDSLGLKAYEIGSYRGVSGDFSSELIKQLYYDEKINAISIDRELVLAEVQTDAPKHLTRLSQSSQLKSEQSLDFIYDSTGGIGVDVYILDSGIDSSNPEFSHRVTKIADFTGEPIDNVLDTVGHGTYIAGVVASQTYGVAKKANLFDVKVTNKKGRTKLSSVISALSMVLSDSKVTKRPTLVVIPLIMKKNALLNGAVEALVKNGIPVIVPAGNDAQQACNYSPASAKGSLTVGAIDVENDSIATFSNWGACVDLFAPGVKVATTNHNSNETAIKSGTSLSSGLAAGMVAYFMGMCDNGLQAVERTLRYGLKGSIPEGSIITKPLTPNKILFNGEGEPNWGKSP